jgi:hypothetical protein
MKFALDKIKKSFPVSIEAALNKRTANSRRRSFLPRIISVVFLFQIGNRVKFEKKKGAFSGALFIQEIIRLKFS